MPKFAKVQKPATNQLTIEWWPAARPVAYARNPRKISDRAVDKVASSIKEYGWRSPIVVDEDDVILAGHTRLLAAHKLGHPQVPVHVAAGLTNAQRKAYRLSDNRVSQESQWDYQLLPLELEELKDLDFDLMLTGFNPDELSISLDGPDFGPGSAEEQGQLDQKKSVVCPHCSYEFTPGT